MAGLPYPLHPACEELPELSAERYAEMVESIREHGLEDAITVHNGVVLDGRHRLRACTEAGVEPRFEEWDGRGGTPVGFIALKQIRRDMTASQRAMWAAEYVLPDEEEAARERLAEGRARGAEATNTGRSPARLPDTGEAREKAAEKAGVSARYVSDAKRVRDRDEALADEVKKGSLSLPEAARRSKLAEKVDAFPADERDRARAFLQGVRNAGKLARPDDQIDIRRPLEDELLVLLRHAAQHADNLLGMPEEDRLRIYVLNESDDERDNSLAMTEAAQLPPMPHPALPHLRDAGRSVARAMRTIDSDAGAASLKRIRDDLAAVISTLKEKAA